MQRADAHGKLAAKDGVAMSMEEGDPRTTAFGASDELTTLMLFLMVHALKLVKSIRVSNCEVKAKNA